MVVCNNYEDYCILHSLRAHGWTRGLKIKGLENKNNEFVFYNMGFNLRPTDISAAIGLNQFKRLKKFQNTRSENRKKIIKNLLSCTSWKNQFSFQEFLPKCDPSFFGFPIIINERFKNKKKKLLKKLNDKGIETRPIVSGNFMNQPVIKKFRLNTSNEKFPNAQFVEDNGFFIGLHTKKISNQKLNLLINSLFEIDKI